MKNLLNSIKAIDWTLLRDQKTALASIPDYQLTTDQRNALNGVLEIIDSLQYAVVADEIISEEVVCGPEPLDTITYRGQEYPVIRIDYKDAGDRDTQAMSTLVSTYELNEILAGDTAHKSVKIRREAQQVDNRIGFFISAEDIAKSIDEIIPILNEQHNGEFIFLPEVKW